MKAWVIEGPQQIVQKEQTAKRLEQTVKVKITRTAITRTDVAFYEGKDENKLPLIPCRIAAGLVSEAGEDSGFHKGERVLISPYSGDKVYGVDMSGFLRDYVVVPESQVIPTPEGISDDELMFTDYIALAISCISEMGLRDHDYIVIIGTGTLGLLLAQLANYHRAIPILVGKNEEDLEFAKTHMGLSYCINSKKQDVQQRVSDITCGEMADCTIFECIGGMDPQFALSLTGLGGKVCIAGFSAYVNKLSVDIRTVVAKQLSVVGVSTGKDTFLSALNLLATKAVKVKDFVFKKENFDDAEDIFKNLNEQPEFGHNMLITVD